jgi:hypothetical protein
MYYFISTYYIHRTNYGRYELHLELPTDPYLLLSFDSIYIVSNLINTTHWNTIDSVGWYNN